MEHSRLVGVLYFSLLPKEIENNIDVEGVIRNYQWIICAVNTHLFCAVRSSSWREGDKDGSEVERERNVTGRGQGWERGRSWDESGPAAPTHHPHRRPWDEDNLPEW